jgi:hypothetical protein
MDRRNGPLVLFSSDFPTDYWLLEYTAPGQFFGEKGCANSVPIAASLIFRKYRAYWHLSGPSIPRIRSPNARREEQVRERRIRRNQADSVDR